MLLAHSFGKNKRPSVSLLSLLSLQFMVSSTMSFPFCGNPVSLDHQSQDWHLLSSLLRHHEKQWEQEYTRWGKATLIKVCFGFVVLCFCRSTWISSCNLWNIHSLSHTVCQSINVHFLNYICCLSLLNMHFFNLFLCFNKNCSYILLLVLLWLSGFPCIYGNYPNNLFFLLVGKHKCYHNHLNARLCKAECIGYSQNSVWNFLFFLFQPFTAESCLLWSTLRKVL